MKKWIIVWILLISLTACGGESGDTEPTTNNTTVNESVPETTEGTSANTTSDNTDEITTDNISGDVDVAAFAEAITLNKIQFDPTERIEITVDIPHQLPGGAWVGLVPSDTPHGSEEESDAVDITYQYLTNAEDGKLVLYAPSTEGQYDVRLFSDDDNGVELDSVSIGVGMAPMEESTNTEPNTTTGDLDISAFSEAITLNKTQFDPTEAIEITVDIPHPLPGGAWVGLVPSDTPHGSEEESDAVDITYQYLTNAEDGKLILYAPSTEGQYDVRLFSDDNNGVELDSISIGVGMAPMESMGEHEGTVSEAEETTTEESMESETTEVSTSEEAESVTEPVTTEEMSMGEGENDGCLVGTWQVVNFSEYLLAVVESSMEGSDIDLELAATDTGELLLSFDGQTMTMSENEFVVTMSMLGRTVPTEIAATGTANYMADGATLTGTTNEAVVSAVNTEQVSFDISNVTGELVTYSCEGDEMVWTEPFPAPLIFAKVSGS